MTECLCRIKLAARSCVHCPQVANYCIEWKEEVVPSSMAAHLTLVHTSKLIGNIDSCHMCCIWGRLGWWELVILDPPPFPLWWGTVIYSSQKGKGLLCVDNDKHGFLVFPLDTCYQEEVYGRWKQLLASGEATLHVLSRPSDLTDVTLLPWSPLFLPPLIHCVGVLSCLCHSIFPWHFLSAIFLLARHFGIPPLCDWIVRVGYIPLERRNSNNSTLMKKSSITTTWPIPWNGIMRRFPTLTPVSWCMTCKQLLRCIDAHFQRHCILCFWITYKPHFQPPFARLIGQILVYNAKFTLVCHHCLINQPLDFCNFIQREICSTGYLASCIRDM